MTAKSQEEIKQEIYRYYQGQPGTQETYTAMLTELQETFGALSPEILSEAAEVLEIKASVLACLVKFSAHLKLADYKHKLVVCTGERCGKRGNVSVLKALKKEFQIGKDGFSQDKRIYLTTQNCMKRCKDGPNLTIDGELFSHMTAERALEVVKAKCLQ